MNGSALAGVVAGLAAAFLQSCSYVVSASFVRGSGKPAWALLAPSFAVMGLFALLILPFTAPAAGAPGLDIGKLTLFAALCIVMCMAGNGAMFFLLKLVDSSRASPLLALKVPMLALAGSVLAGGGCNAAQWCAVALVMVSAVLVAGAGRPIPPVAWAWLVVSCACYCASDWCITLSMGECKASFGENVAGYSFFALSVIYIVGGCFSLAALCVQGVPPRSHWVKWAVPHAACWFSAMAALFACFAMSGLVLGNIVQSSRGLISVAIGWMLARAGITALEEKVPPAVVARRVFAAVLLVAAMAMYSTADAG